MVVSPIPRGRRAIVGLLSFYRRMASPSAFSQQQIDDPAAADVFAVVAAVREDVGVGAAGVFEGVGQQRQAVEGAGVVNRLRHLADRAIVPGEPRSRRGRWMERIAKYTANHVGLNTARRVNRRLCGRLPSWLVTDRREMIQSGWRKPSSRLHYENALNGAKAVCNSGGLL